jgi:phosphopantothenoylcysteine decarboxylase/phosphopantothenate--cysteine ligase
METHPSKDIKYTLSKKLDKKTIILCVTGSVAAYKAIDLARQLVRHGAEVIPIMSESAKEILHPNILTWATGNKVITEITGNIEHVSLSGDGGADLILVSPATANTINKVANGISDTTVTLIVNTALGSGIPIIMVPAMHEPLYTNPITQRNIENLKGLGVEFIGPKIIEGKAKIAEVDEITNYVIRKIGFPKDMKNKKILVIGGPTVEYIDAVRIITNKSSGRMGISLALEGYYRGGDVKLILGQGLIKPPAEIDTICVDTTEDMYNMVMRELETNKYDIIINSAAPVDYKPKESIDYKLETDKIKALTIELESTIKIADHIRKRAKDAYIVLFKAEYKVSKKILVERAYKKLVSSNADLIVANDVGKQGVGFRTPTNEVYVIDKEKNIIHIPLNTKEKVAEVIYNIISNKLGI